MLNQKDIDKLQELLIRVEPQSTEESLFCWELLKKLDKIVTKEDYADRNRT